MGYPDPCCTKEKMIHWCHICRTKRCPELFPKTSVRIDTRGTIVCIDCADEVVEARRLHKAEYAPEIDLVPE